MKDPLRFAVSPKEQEKAQPFMERHEHPELKGVTDGGNTIAWMFCQNSIGVEVYVRCVACKAIMNVTDYSYW